MNCCFPKSPNSLNGVWYTSLIAPRKILGRTLSISLPPWLITWLILFVAIALISFCSGLDDSRCNFGSLINHASACTVKVVVVKKASKLPVALSAFAASSIFILLYDLLFCYCLTFHIWILNAQVQQQQILKVDSFLILIGSLKDLFNISSHKRSLSVLNSLISSPQNMDITNPFEFCGKLRIKSVSILIHDAGSTFTTFGE